ncbi:unnamed protein product [Owenia fusiformis]|uniref:diphosphoinositol-polyphosphate diphosphatase n=1 Tax=Owenia fusiformis TaxID=6347 RepID=A0A8S4N3W9_OWEFU|nr:unnamed protein product [Owenia fusiformis]
MVKEKPNSVRTYDEDGFKRRAACLCFKDETEQELMLITSSKEPERWIVPGGGIEPTEDSLFAAQREALEEAGVKGVVSRELGVFENCDRKTRTHVFVLIVTEAVEDWEEAISMGRQRKWFSFADAKAQLALHKPVQTSYLDLVNGKINGKKDGVG